ncbi:MAG TPA: hypothetical protein VOA87_16140 [Thermoanaerobaculia bacterium]|nr:hypothetical protein [Thermoanaerobaculia bacterium]
MIRRARQEGRRRSPWPALLLPLVFAGALDLHPAGEAHDALAGIRQRTVVSATDHSGRALHLHAATTEEHPLCPACLLRFQTGGAHLTPLPRLAAAPPPAAALQAAASPSATRYYALPRAARGPPIA